MSNKMELITPESAPNNFFCLSYGGTIDPPQDIGQSLL